MPQMFVRLVFENPWEAATSGVSKNVHAIWNFELTPWQGHAVEALLNRRDIIVKAGTGYGKSMVYLSMIHAKEGAIVLVVCPLLSLMEDQVLPLASEIILTVQVRTLRQKGITAVAINPQAKENDEQLWTRVDRGEFSIVYTTPETLLSKDGHFMKQTVRQTGRNVTKFMKNLITVAIDESHLAWDWDCLRPHFQFIGNLRMALWDIPFVTMSATMAPNVTAYVQKTFRLKTPTALAKVTIRRDNINIMVVPKEGTGIEPLLKLIPPRMERLDVIPLTLIFVDAVDPGIHIARALRALLPPIVEGLTPTDIIHTYFGSVDDETKGVTLEMLHKDKSRIAICTDAFGLGVNIRVIERVIQWGVAEKLSINSLVQRIGRAGRDTNITGLAIIYVSTTILTEINGDWMQAWDPDAELDPRAEWESGCDDPAMVSNSRNLDKVKFGLPVDVETMRKVQHLKDNLYRQAQVFKDAKREDKNARTGTRTDKVTPASKLDPSVLWIIATVGCRWRAILCIYDDSEVFSINHRSWCCDACAKRVETDPDTLTVGIPLSISVHYSTEAKHRRKMTKRVANVPSHPKRPAAVVSLQPKIEEVVKLWRGHALESMGLPAGTLPILVLADEVCKRIADNVRAIVTVDKLREIIEKAGVDIESSLLEPSHTEQLFYIIDMACKTLPPVLEAPPASSIRHPLPKAPRPMEALPTLPPVSEVPSSSASMQTPPSPCAPTVEPSGSSLKDPQAKRRRGLNDSTSNASTSPKRTRNLPPNPLLAIVNENVSRMENNKRLRVPSRRMIEEYGDKNSK